MDVWNELETGHGYLFDFVQILQRAQTSRSPQHTDREQGNPQALTKI